VSLPEFWLSTILRIKDLFSSRYCFRQKRENKKLKKGFSLKESEKSICSSESRKRVSNGIETERRREEERKGTC